MRHPRKRHPFARVQLQTMPPNAGKWAVVSTGAQWGVYDTEEAATEKAQRLNELTDVP